MRRTKSMESSSHPNAQSLSHRAVRLPGHSARKCHPPFGICGHVVMFVFVFDVDTADTEEGDTEKMILSMTACAIKSNTRNTSSEFGRWSGQFSTPGQNSDSCSDTGDHLWWWWERVWVALCVSEERRRRRRGGKGAVCVTVVEWRGRTLVERWDEWEERWETEEVIQDNIEWEILSESSAAKAILELSLIDTIDWFFSVTETRRPFPKISVVHQFETHFSLMMLQRQSSEVIRSTEVPWSFSSDAASKMVSKVFCVTVRRTLLIVFDTLTVVDPFYDCCCKRDFSSHPLSRKFDTLLSRT